MKVQLAPSATRIPFNRPFQTGREETYLREALASGHLSGDGPFTRKCQALLESALGAGKASLTTSCTHALEMAGLLLDLGPGDEVILPSFTFVSTANAWVLRGAKLVWADIRPDTLNLDERQLEDLVTPRTRAIVPVHYAGVGCEMDAIRAVAERHGIAVIEDNAHGLFGKYRGRFLGTLGALATQSFHVTKNFTCGEGGALLVNDPRLRERAEIIREKGTDRSKFLLGLVNKYGWVDVGSSYLPSDLLAALLLAQLEAREEIQRLRGAVWDFYFRSLGEWASSRGLILPTVPAHCEQTYHIFYLLLPTSGARKGFLDGMRKLGVDCTFHYLPLNSSSMGERLGGHLGQCPVTESVSERLVRLPLYADMTEAERERVVSAAYQVACELL